MAGRPVAARGGGGNGLLYGLIAFVITTVLALGGMIFALTNVQREQDERSRLATQLAAQGTPPAYYSEEARALNTNAFAVMSRHIEDLALLVGGRRELRQPDIATQWTTLQAAAQQRHPQALPQGASMLSAVDALDRALTAEKGRVTELTDRVAALEAERDSLAAGLKAAQDEFQATVAQLNEESQRAEQERTNALAAKDQQLATITSASESRTEEWNRDRLAAAARQREEEIERGRLTRQLTDLRTEVESLKTDTFDPNAILTKADGRVARAIPGSDVVYINLGERDGLKPGYGFEVYTEAPGSNDNSVRGKATIEVATVMNETSECIVTRTTPGQPIVEGDLIVNIAFEAGRRPKFLVRGSFDLNYDGVVDDSDIDRVSAIIRDWGGQVVDELDESVDYVVVGVAPETPRVQPGRKITPVMQVQFERTRLASERFREVVQQAQSLYIPVITQSQFLFLTGYTGDISIRQR